MTCRRRTVGDWPVSTNADDVEEVRQWLRQLGAQEHELRIDPQELPGVASNVLFRRGATLSARQLAERCDMPVEDVLSLYREIGIAIDDVDRAQFSEAEVDLQDLLRSAVVEKFTPQEGHELVVVMARALSGIADASVAEYVQTVEARLLDGGGSLLDWARANAEAAELARRLGGSMGPLFWHYLRQSVEHQREAQENVSSRAVMRVAVGFVDLVGFTPFSSRLSPEELSRMVGELESRAFDLATGAGARIVKHIGDEIMFTAVDPDAACDLALALRDGVGTTTARPRGGLAYGEVISRHGDYYGPVVNLASRLTEEAIPGEILVPEPLRDAASGYTFEPAGRRLLKGFDEPVTVLSLD